MGVNILIFYVRIKMAILVQPATAPSLPHSSSTMVEFHGTVLFGHQMHGRLCSALAVNPFGLPCAAVVV
eukprot:UN0291